jgi:phage N-6-adenine-methyltransferase
MSRKMPAQTPGESRQDYGTPGEFIDAVEHRFGVLAHDLAADAHNTRAAHFFDEARDALVQDWTKLKGNLWLNPPFANIAPWAKKCAESGAPGRLIFFLTPASTGANWFRDHVFDKALVLLLGGRLTFEGCEDPYPKDCILSVFGTRPGFELWNWSKDVDAIRASLAQPKTSEPEGKATLPPGRTMSRWEIALARALEAMNDDVESPEADGEEATVEALTGKPKKERKPRKDKGQARTPHPSQETDEEIRAELAKAPVSTTNREAAVKPATVEGTSNGVKYSLSEDTARALYLERAVFRDKLLTAAEAKNKADAWILLQHRAPSGWFDRGPYDDEPGAKNGKAANVDTNFGDLATDLAAAGAPVSIITLAQFTPMEREVMRSWLANDKGNLDALPEWWRGKVGWKEPTPKMDAWDIAVTALVRWEAGEATP